MNAPPSLQDLGEEEVVRRLIIDLPVRENVLIGAGDDCAVIDRGGEELLLLKTDSVVSGIHFLVETDPERVGWKAVGRVVSDFGAMGGRVSEILITLALPSDCPMDWIEGLYRGLSRCAREFGASIVGGETVGLGVKSGAGLGNGPMVITVSGTGWVGRKQVVTRAGGSVGEGLWVTGKLGGSFESERHLDFVPRMREGQWLAQYAGVTAMMDLSDGLQRDLPRLAAASDCKFTLEMEDLPRHDGCSEAQALGDGEDMELLFSATEGPWIERFQEAFPEVGVTRIGELVKEGCMSLGQSGWQHFREEKKEER